MALPAGQITFTLEFGKDLKDQDWFGRMDPYAVITCGGQRFRSKTHTDGGRNPVWNQSFQFNVINENTVAVELYDSDTFSRDDKIGSCTVDLSRARMSGADSQQVAVRTGSKGKQHGFISVRIAFKSNQPSLAALPPAAAAALPSGYGAPQPYGAPPYGYAPAPSFAPYGPPPPQPAYTPQPSYHYQPSFQQPPPAPYGQPASYPPAPGAAPPAAPPPVTPSPSGYYPSVPTTQQFYPGPAPPQGGPPPPLRLY